MDKIYWEWGRGDLSRLHLGLDAIYLCVGKFFFVRLIRSFLSVFLIVLGRDP